MFPISDVTASTSELLVQSGTYRPIHMCDIYGDFNCCDFLGKFDGKKLTGMNN